MWQLLMFFLANLLSLAQSMLFCKTPSLELRTSGTFAFCPTPPKEKNRCTHIFHVLPPECSLLVSGYILDFLSEQTQVIELMKTIFILRICQESPGYTQLSYKLVRIQVYIKFIGEPTYISTLLVKIRLLYLKRT